MAQVKTPTIGTRDVLIKVSNASICGSDVHIYSWDHWSESRIVPPKILGHEFCGVVAEVGDEVSSVKPGERVSAEMHFTCGRCCLCRTGQGHICQAVTIAGVDVDGCFAEYVAVPEPNVWKTEHLGRTEVGALLDPLGNAVHAALAGEVAGRTVAITGCGPIGLCTVAVLRKTGAASVFAVDVNEYRLDLARRMGADVVVNGRKLDPVQTVLDATSGIGCDVVLEMSGNPGAIRQGFRMLRKGGRMSLIGIPEDPVQLDLAEEVIFKGALVYGINGRRMYDTWYTMDGLLKSGLDLEPLITHRFALDDFREAFELALSGQCGKIVFELDGASEAAR